jgi:triosephosphate isomerase
MFYKVSNIYFFMKRVIVNFKTYKQGSDVLRLARKIEAVDKNIIVGVSPLDVYRVSRETKLRVFCQHVDFFDVGRNTGFVLPEAVKANGARGVFLNHSEHKLKFDDLAKSVKRCKKIGLEVCVFASGLSEALKIKKLKPDYLVAEPPELVGGNVSVSSKKGYVSKLAKKLGCDFYVGAGVKTKEDVSLAIRDGALGIAVASGVIGAKNPGKVLGELVEGLK